jgi:hypothetical protein
MRDVSSVPSAARAPEATLWLALSVEHAGGIVGSAGRFVSPAPHPPPPPSPPPPCVVPDDDPASDPDADPELPPELDAVPELRPAPELDPPELEDADPELEPDPEFEPDPELEPPPTSIPGVLWLPDPHPDATATIQPRTMTDVERMGARA